MKKNLDVFAAQSANDFFIRYLWTDKKRYFGLPWSFTGYSLSEDRLFEDRGLIFSKHNEILLYRVRDISVTISLWQRIFGVGTIRIFSADSSSPSLHIINVKNPMGVKELIHVYVEKAKDEKGVHFGEYVGASI